MTRTVIVGLDISQLLQSCSIQEALRPLAYPRVSEFGSAESLDAQWPLVLDQRSHRALIPCYLLFLVLVSSTVGS